MDLSYEDFQDADTVDKSYQLLLQLLFESDLHELYEVQLQKQLLVILQLDSRQNILVRLLDNRYLGEKQVFHLIDLVKFSV